MSEYTKGPWIHSSYEGGWDCVRQTDHNGPILAKLALNTPSNAKLMAAAPELLVVIKKLIDLTDAASFQIELQDAIAEAETIIERLEQ